MRDSKRTTARGRDAQPGAPLGPVPYLDPTDPDNPDKVCADYTLYTGQTTLTGGWYVVTGDITNDTRVTVSGDVNLILADGASLADTDGVNVSEGNVITIWAQSNATVANSRAGHLTATTTDHDKAGIGGDVNQSAGSITINGGHVTASCNSDGQFKALGTDSNQLTDFNLSADGYALKSRWYYGVNAYDDGTGGLQYVITIYSDSARTNAARAIGASSAKAAFDRSVHLGSHPTTGTTSLSYGTFDTGGSGAGIGGGFQGPGGTITVNGGKGKKVVQTFTYGKAMRSPSSIAAMVSALGTCVPSMMKGIRFSRMTVLMYTVRTDEAERPTSLQKCVKRSFVRSSMEKVMLAMVSSLLFVWETGGLHQSTALKRNVVCAVPVKPRSLMK